MSQNGWDTVVEFTDSLNTHAYRILVNTSVMRLARRDCDFLKNEFWITVIDWQHGAGYPADAVPLPIPILVALVRLGAYTTMPLPETANA